MYYVLLFLLIADAVLLATVVLLQAGKGGGLAAMGGAGAGSDSLFGSRQAATLLTKATWWTGGIFLVLSFVLSTMSGRVSSEESILRGAIQPTQSSQQMPEVVQPVAPAPEGGPAEGSQ